MKLKNFLKLNSVSILSNVNNDELFQKDIKRISLVAFPGNLFWVQKDDFVFVIVDFVGAEDLIKIMRGLISKGIMGCCIAQGTSNENTSDEILSLFSLNQIPLFQLAKGNAADKFWTSVLSPLMEGEKIVSFFEQQLKNNIICLMSTENFNAKNLTAMTSMFLHHEVYLLSKNFHLICHSSYISGRRSNDLPLKKWSDEIEDWNINQTYSLEPVIFEHNGCEYYCFPLKSYKSTIGYLCIEKYNKICGDINSYFIAEILPNFILCIMSTSDKEVMHRKSIDEYLQNILYGLFTDENTLKCETAYYNFEYFLNRYVWILQIEPLNRNKYAVENYIPDTVLSKAKNICQQIFYQNMFLTEKLQIASIHIKSDKHNEKVLDKFQMIINNLEMQCPEYSFHIGISRAYTDMHKLKYAYEDATFSLIMGKTLFSNTNKKFFCYDDLLIYHLLYQQIDNPILERLYNNTIRKIKAYDMEKQDQLYETLNELINLDFNLTQAHDNLYIHRNTLYQRIKKIEKIIGLSVKSLETKLLLQLGIKLDHIHSVIKKREERD